MADIIYPCAHCGVKNRLTPEKLRKNPVCGKCGKPVFPDAPVNATDASFRAEVEDCPIPVLVDFWAPWCGPCRMVAPELEKLAKEMAGRVKIVKVNVDENPRSASQFGIRSIPTMILFRGPLVVDTIQGAMPAASLKQRLEQWV